MTAPVAASGSEPAWIARVAKPRRSQGAGASAPTPACSSGSGVIGSAGAFGVDVTAPNGTPRLGRCRARPPGPPREITLVPRHAMGTPSPGAQYAPVSPRRADAVPARHPCGPAPAEGG